MELDEEMKEYKTIAKQIGGSYIIQIVSIMISFFYFSVVTRFLSVEEYGILSLILTVIVILTGINSFGIIEYLVKEFAGKTLEYKRKLIKTFVPFTTYLGIFLILIVGLFLKNFLKLFSLEQYYSYFLAGLIICILKILSRPILGILSSEKKIITNRIMTMVIENLWMLIVIIMGFVFSKLNLNIIINTQLITIGIVTLIGGLWFLIIYKINYFAINKLNKNKIKSMFKFTLPLIPLVIAQWLITTADRFIIKYYHTAGDVGNYTYVYSMLSFAFLFVSLIILVIYPYLAEAFNKKNIQKYNFMFNTGIKYSYMLLLPLLFGFLALSKEFITLISGNQFLISVPLIPILLFFPVFQLANAHLQRVLILNNKTKEIFWIYTTGVIINLVLNFILIPKYIIKGAAIATIISYIIMTIGFYYFARKDFKWNFKLIQPLKILLSVIIMYFAINFIEPKIWIFKILIIMLGGIIYISLLIVLKVFNKSEINFIKKLIKR